jgi:hypothetical protein
MRNAEQIDKSERDSPRSHSLTFAACEHRTQTVLRCWFSEQVLRVVLCLRSNLPELVLREHFSLDFCETGSELSFASIESFPSIWRFRPTLSRRATLRATAIATCKAIRQVRTVRDSQSCTFSRIFRFRKAPMVVEVSQSATLL